MPLLPGSDPDTISANIQAEVRVGKSHKQAVAIALAKARESMPNPGETHYAPLGALKTACGESAKGRDGVALRSDIPSRVTCKRCRKVAGIRGPIDKGSKAFAAAGAMLSNTARKFGGLVLAQEQRSPRRRKP